MISNLRGRPYYLINDSVIRAAAHFVFCVKLFLKKDKFWICYKCGISKLITIEKMLGTNVKSFYCMECLADYLGCTIEDLLEKIEEFKDEGCTLFK